MLGSSLLVRSPGRAGICCHEGQHDAGAMSGTEGRVVWCSFDEILEMSARGNNSAVDMLVGDIYGGMDYSKVTPPRAGRPSSLHQATVSESDRGFSRTSDSRFFSKLVCSKKEKLWPRRKGEQIHGLSWRNCWFACETALSSQKEAGSLESADVVRVFLVALRRCFPKGSVGGRLTAAAAWSFVPDRVVRHHYREQLREGGVAGQGPGGVPPRGHRPQPGAHGVLQHRAGEHTRPIVEHSKRRASLRNQRSTSWEIWDPASVLPRCSLRDSSSRNLCHLLLLRHPRRACELRPPLLLGGQISVLNAMRYGLKRIFFGGFFIRGHSYTMDTISVAINFW
jgi:hypothetical protein